MVQFNLPKNSQVKKGKAWPAPVTANGKKPKRTKDFKVYRYDPDEDANPRIDIYRVDLDSCGPMVLDALIKIKNEIDPTLTFRRSCREGVCGSCAMNIAGGNTLACTKAISDISGSVSDLSAAAHAGGQGPRAGHDEFLRAIRVDPALSADEIGDAGEPSGSNRRKTAPSSTGFTSASSAPAARPPVPAIGGIQDRYLGPAALLQSYRWLADSRDEAKGERLDNLEDPFRLYRCHTIMNCANACPKGLNPAEGHRRDQTDDGEAEFVKPAYGDALRDSHMTEAPKAELVWNRALGNKAFRFLEGDLNLIVLLTTHGYVMNGGVFHAVEAREDEEMAEIADAYRYFGLDDIANLLTEAKSILDADDDWGPLEDKFYERYSASISDDSALFERFKAVLLRDPSKFTPI